MKMENKSRFEIEFRKRYKYKSRSVEFFIEIVGMLFVACIGFLVYIIIKSWSFL